MRTPARFGIIVLGIAALASLLDSGRRAEAAPITWGLATAISGDTDVSTNGTPVAAFNFGGPTVGSTTVNGVLFQPFPGPSTFVFTTTTFTVGNFSLTSDGYVPFSDTSSTMAPFTNLSPSYQALVGTAVESIGTNTTLSLGGLTPGREYEFQTWVNDSSGGTFNPVTVSDDMGDSVDLSAGGLTMLGSYVLGTFTADAASEQVVFEGEAQISNGFQLRDITPAAPPAPVPEPSSLALLTLGGVALAGWRRWKKRQRRVTA